MRIPDLELHLIGPLQSNKVRDAVAMFDVIHTLDRPKLAQALKAEMAARGKAVRLLIRSTPARRSRRRASRQPISPLSWRSPRTS